MRKIFGIALCILLLTATAAYAELKIAVFDLQVVVGKSEALQEAQTEMKKQYEGERVQLEKQRQDLEKKAVSFTGKESEQEKEAFLKAQREYSDKAAAYVRKIQAAELQIREEMDKVLIQAARDYATKKGFNLILDTQSAIYFDQAMDITNDMVTEANRVWRDAKKK